LSGDGPPQRRAFPLIVLSGGGFQGLAVVRAAAATADVRVVVADSLPFPLTASLADEVVKVPPVADEQRLLETLEVLIDRLGPGLLLPATEYELPFLAQHRERLEAAGARVGAASREALAQVGDRRSLASELDRLGVARARELTLEELTEEALPLLAKPRRSSWGGRGQLVLRTPGELAAFRARADREAFFVERWLAAFREYSLDFAIGFAGEVSTLVARERLRTTGGFCVVARSVDDPALLADGHAVGRRLAALGCRGLVSLQALETAEGRFVSDLNLRSGTSGVLALERGVNLVEFLVRSARGEPPRSAEAMPARLQWRLLVESSRPAVLPPVEGVVFDLDDTLLDQKAWILAKLEAASVAVGSELADPGAFVLEAWTVLEEGDRARTIDAAAERLGLAAPLAQRLIEAYRAAVPEPAPVYADVAGALATLREAGMKLALLTDNPPSSQRQKVAAAGLEAYFDAIVFSRDLGAEKPAPEGYLMAAAKLGLRPERTVAIGDHPLREGRAALSAGAAHFFWITRGGGFFAVHPGTMTRRLPELAARTTRIGTLREAVDALVRG